MNAAVAVMKKNTATFCNSLQHTATHCNTLQHTATYCNTLQHAVRQQICRRMQMFQLLTRLLQKNEARQRRRRRRQMVSVLECVAACCDAVRCRI